MNIPANITNEEEPYWENKKFEKSWESVYENNHFQPITSIVVLLLDGNTIINNKILDPKNISLKEVLFIYIPKIWDNNVEYQRILEAADTYHQTAPFVGKSN